VAALIGVTENSIVYWENERYAPHVSYYPAIIQFLGYSPLVIDTTTLGGRMKKYRFENGLSQEDLARKIGVNESTIFHWEKGDCRPMGKKLRLLENVMYLKELSD